MSTPPAFDAATRERFEREGHKSGRPMVDLTPADLRAALAEIDRLSAENARLRDWANAAEQDLQRAIGRERRHVT